MVKKFLYLSFLFLIVNMTFVCSGNIADYLYFVEGNETSKHKISYSIDNEPDKKGLFFVLDVYYKDEVFETCRKSLDFEDDVIFKKITCEFEDMGDGEYKFIGKVMFENNELESVVNNIYLYDSVKGDMKFIVKDKETLIFINIDGNGEDMLVKQRIPKEVIELLTHENKESLVHSDIPYDILEEDPLIAWNIKETPSSINYTIKKKVSPADQEKFGLEITENSYLQSMEILTYFLVFVFLLLIFMPLVRKKLKK